MELNGSSIVVAGASGVLRSEISLRLAAMGAHLTLSGRSVDRLRRPEFEDAHLVAADLRDPAASKGLLDAALAAHGRVDMVVNAAGVVAFGSVDELDSDTLEELFMTNVFAAVFLSQATLSVLSEGGTIAHISGVIAEQNFPGMAAYGASKAALRSFNEGFGREARRRKIRVLDIRPPHTETGLVNRAIAGTAPAFPEGLSPSSVAEVIVGALADPTVRDVPADRFG